MKLPVAPSYSSLQKAAHWLLLGLCVSQFPTAYAIHRTHEADHHGSTPAPFDMFLHQVHAWSGWTILMLAIALLAIRVTRGAPAPPHGMSPWQRWLAHAAHAGLYGLILALAVTGTGAMYVWREFATIHNILTDLGIALVALHVLAVIWHQFIRRDGVLLRMLPAGRDASAALRRTASKAASGRPIAGLAKRSTGQSLPG
jgi:cytochrome b561